MSANLKSVIYLFTKLLDLVLIAVEYYKKKKKEKETAKIKKDAVSSFLDMFNPASKDTKRSDNDSL